MRLTKIYTRKGDDGTTSLDGHNRLPKNDIRVETMGAIDELNSAIGLTISFMENKEIADFLRQVQQDLFNLGGELCPPHRAAMTADNVILLEQTLDKWNDTLPALKEFILPGGNPDAASCHLARTICRRAERCLVALNQVEQLSPVILKYVNRLSDVLFVVARILARDAKQNEILWNHEKRKE